MSVNKKELEAFQKRMDALRDDIPEIMEELIIGEGVFAVGEARNICGDDKPDIIDTGNYRNSFHAGDKSLRFKKKEEHDGSKPKKSGEWYKIDVYNNADYANHLENGFRSHFVPGYWEGKGKSRRFVYVEDYRELESRLEKNEPRGMYVGKPGGYVRGRFTLQRAIKRTKQTQEVRLKIKMEKIFDERLGEDWRSRK